jgi:hypothetical protein
MASGEATREKTKAGTCPTHGAVQGTKSAPVFRPPGLFYMFKAVGSALQPYRCPQCGARVS